MLSELEETIDTGTHGYTSGISMRSSEMAECATLYIFHLSCLRVIFLLVFPEIPVHSVLNARSHIDVLECREVRQTDLEIVGHSVLELIPESRLVELRCLEIYPVLESGVITERELLVELLLADPVLSLERVEAVYRECHVRQGERVRAVLRVLIVQGIDGQVHLSIPVLRVRDR